MWDVDNTTPFACHAGFQRDHAARSLWCLFLKASFTIRHDQAPLFLTVQPPLALAPVFDGPRLLADSDICPPRPQCDLTLTGHALPPAGQAAGTGWLAGLRIGNWQKQVQILPPAVLRNGRVQPLGDAAAPVPLGWESAFGGEGFDDNPVGTGFPPGRDGTPLPRLAPPGEGHATRRPAGFAPVPRSWPARQRLGGTYDAEWQRRRAPLLPADLDPRYWQAAPSDQWLDPAGLPGAEVLLAGIRPEPVRFRLPSLRFEMATRFAGRWIQHAPLLQSIAIDTDRMQLSMVWAGGIAIGAAQHDVMVGQSVIALRDHTGFAVTAADAPAFSDRLLGERSFTGPTDRESV